MGDPAEVSPADRAATQQLAQRIVQAVIDDEAMPLDLHATPSGMVARWEVESLVFQLAQELVQTRRELEEACDLAEEANGDPSSCSYIVPVGERIQELREKGRMP